MTRDKAKIGELHVWIEENQFNFSTISALRLFLAVSENPGISCLEAAAICNISTPTVSRLVAAMSREDDVAAILRVEFQEQDRRINCINLSKNGQKVRANLLRAMDDPKIL